MISCAYCLESCPNQGDFQLKKVDPGWPTVDWSKLAPGWPLGPASRGSRVLNGSYRVKIWKKLTKVAKKEG